MNGLTFTFQKLPASVDELKQLAQGKMNNDKYVAALSMAALCSYGENPQLAIDMLNVLKGPQPLSPFEIQFLRDRLAGKSYKPFSFFAGSSPENGYKPTAPYTITVYDSPYSYPEENYATLYLQSTGADSPRNIKLRKKPSTGEWFLLELQMLSDIRIPTEEDPWA